MEANSKNNRLQKFLQDAYYSQVDLQISEKWQSVVMDRIGEIEVAQSTKQDIFMAQFERFIWRLAPLAAVLLMVLIIALYRVELVAGGDIIQLISHEFDSLNNLPL